MTLSRLRARERAVVTQRKEQCRCRLFCLEDTERTGRYCQLKLGRLAAERRRKK